MTQATLSPETRRTPEELEAYEELEYEEPGLILGRPVEDRSFEAVEAGAGMFVGAAIGSAVAGPVGTALGGILGVAAGFVVGEAVERAAGRAATTTDAEETETPNLD